MADGTPDKAHEEAVDLVEQAVGKLDDEPGEAGKLLRKAESIDPDAAREVLADLDEDAESDHTPKAG